MLVHKLSPLTKASSDPPSIVLYWKAVVVAFRVFVMTSIVRLLTLAAGRAGQCSQHSIRSNLAAGASTWPPPPPPPHRRAFQSINNKLCTTAQPSPAQPSPVVQWWTNLTSMYIVLGMWEIGRLGDWDACLQSLS